MNVLVTGGAGFIGSHIAQALLERGDFVRLLDNFTTGRRENAEQLLHEFGGAKVKILEGDIRDASLVNQTLRNVEIVFHSAAFVSVPRSMEEPRECFDVNVTGTHLLLDSARKAGVRRAVLASSAAVYGEAEALPLVEEALLQPMSPYAVSKRVNEIYSTLFTHSFGLEVVALRYFNVYGPRQRPDSTYAAAVPIFIRALLEGRPITIFGDGRQSRDLISVRDVVRANLIASEHLRAPGNFFNICTGEETRLLDLLNELYKLFPSASAAQFSAPRAGDIVRSVGSPQKAREFLGFSADTSLAAGLHETVEWMRAKAPVAEL